MQEAELHDIARRTVRGTWFRHVAPGLAPTLAPPSKYATRWLASDVLSAIYLASRPETAWAEWYRRVATTNAAPSHWLPRELWSIEVDLPGVADLSGTGALDASGLPGIAPDESQWPAYQSVGARLVRENYRGILAPSAAHTTGLVLVVFAPSGTYPRELLAKGPAELVSEAPPVPRGLRT